MHHLGHRDAVHAGCEALVDRSQEEQHHRGAGVHEPERRRPFDLDAAGDGELVGLVVPIVVVLLACAHDHVNRRNGHPRLAPLRDPFVLVQELGDPAAHADVGDDDETLSLREAAAGCATNRPDDSLDASRAEPAPGRSAGPSGAVSGGRRIPLRCLDRDEVGTNLAARCRPRLMMVQRPRSAAFEETAHEPARLFGRRPGVDAITSHARPAQASASATASTTWRSRTRRSRYEHHLSHAGSRRSSARPITAATGAEPRSCRVLRRVQHARRAQCLFAPLATRAARRTDRHRSRRQPVAKLVPYQDEGPTRPGFVRLHLIVNDGPGRLRRTAYSHSIVAGGFDVTSSTTRLTAGISLTIRDEIVSIRSYGSRAQSAVIASSLVTARSTIG